MDQRKRLPAALAPRGIVPAGIVSTAAAGSAGAHVVAAVSGPAGAMALWMAAMGVACLACVAPLVSGRFCVGTSQARNARWAANTSRAGSARRARSTSRASGHLLAMSAAMILIHLILLVAPGAAGHQGSASHPGNAGQGGMAEAAFSSGHAPTMLALIGIELLCLVGASAALRLSRRSLPGASRRSPLRRLTQVKPPVPVPTAARTAVEH
ncbi:hypothetical protein ACIQC5_08295 [Paenarthrobacter sp. NPDC092416]|uniref:hypothetical protein n=1 Tax=Paenarthrobacter sp. NPDC092416 TaxID=3364386 RepID=UPI0038089D73